MGQQTRRSLLRPGRLHTRLQRQASPGYISNLDKLKEKKVDVVACIAFNDAWVMSAWGKANGIKDESIVRLYLHIQKIEERMVAD